MVSAHLSATGQLGQVASLCLGVTLLDMTEAGTTVSLMDAGTAKASMLASRARGYMDGRTLAEVFAWLRPNDLIWNYWVHNYLEGKTMKGSWWPDYTTWLADRSGDMKQAPRTLGSAKFRPLAPAPGTFVFER